jgi:hypothetical protein
MNRKFRNELARCRPGHCVLTDDGLVLTEREACLRKYEMDFTAAAANFAPVPDPVLEDAA